MTYDDDRDRIEMPEDEATEKRGEYPPMPPLDAAEPDLEQEGERPNEPDSGWGGAAQTATGERTVKDEGGGS